MYLFEKSIVFKIKLKCIKIIIKTIYFKYFAKHILNTFKFLSNVQLLKIYFQNKYEIFLPKINFYSLFILIAISRKSLFTKNNIV